MKKIILTGGGTAGHVTPNIALLPALEKEGFSVEYIGAVNGMEKGLIEKTGIPYHGVSTGKFRRQLNAKNLKNNFTDIFRVISGVGEAKKIIGRIKPDVVFSKGGFVSVPVVLGAKLNGVPVIVHESDITPGLANKISMPFAEKVCTSFPETVQYVGEKGVYTGTPIREELFKGSKEAGLSLCGFSNDKPVILMMGGSQGSVKINKFLRESLDELLKDFCVIHLCGKGNYDKSLEGREGYKQFEYASDELKDLFAACDIVVSRAGSNAINEFAALKKPSLLIPLPARNSRGDQLLNADSFKKQGFSMVLDEDTMTKDILIKALYELYEKRDSFIDAMRKSTATNGIGAVMDIIVSVSGVKK